MNTNKQTKSFRLSPVVADLVAKAAKKAGLSEGEIIEGCIINQAEAVISEHERVQARLRSSEAVEQVAGAGIERPRDERSDKGTRRGPRKEAQIRRLPKDHVS